MAKQRQMELVITDKDDLKMGKNIKVTGIEIHPENNTILLIEIGQENTIQSIAMDADKNYYIHLGV